ncbi:TPA: alpha/beta hydrolase [Salmonella enterica subsp. enterica serovar Eastbourne]
MQKRIMALFLVATGFIPLDSDASAIRWESCLNSKFRSWFEDNLPHPRTRCGYLEVPLSYSNNTDTNHNDQDRPVRIALTLLPARNVRQGSLLIISGGPGQSGINPWLDTDWPVNRLNESWDIVGYDPRGVGQSIPKIDCTAPEKSSFRPVTPEQEIRNRINACTDKTGAEVLKHIGTDEAVNDVDQIRKALGESKLTAVAYSYGTQVALFYAERFPDAVRALVLDGVVDLNEAKDGFAWQITQARGYQSSFERFASWCAETGSCPLSADRRLANQQYQSLLRRLNTRPLYGPEGQQISSDDLISLTTSLLLWRTSWPLLATAVRQLSHGIISKEIVDALSYASSSYGEQDALDAITCADQASSDYGQNDILHKKKLIREAFPAINFLHSAPLSPDLCDLWPWKNNVHSKRPANIPHLPQLLFVAQRHDPTTPWSNAKSMATQFNSPLVTREGDGHTLVLSGISLCVDKMVVDYLTGPDKKSHDKICL